MLRFLRKSRRLQLFIFGGLAALFILWGVGGTFGARQGVFAGKLYGRQVPLRDLQRQVDTVVRALRLTSGDVVPASDVVETEAWRRLLMLEEARRAHLAVPDADVVATIQRIPAFQRDGRFDAVRYEQYLAFQRLPPRQFEEEIRQHLLIGRLREHITADIVVDETQARAAYDAAHQRWRLRYVAVPWSRFRRTAEQWLARAPRDTFTTYHAQHADAFRGPAQLTLRYVQFPAPTDSPADDRPTLAELERLLQTQPWTLDDMAETFTLQMQTAGPFTGAAIPGLGTVPAWQSWLADGAAGSLSPAVAHGDGLLLATLDSRQPGVPLSFEVAADNVRAAVLRDRLQTLAQELATTVRATLAPLGTNAAALAKAARRQGVSVRESPLVGTDDQLEGQPAAALIDQIRLLTVGAWSEPITWGEQTLLVQVLESVAPDEAAWLRDRDGLMATQRAQQQDARWQAFLTEAVARAQPAFYLR